MKRLQVGRLAAEFAQLPVLVDGDERTDSAPALLDDRLLALAERVDPLRELCPKLLHTEEQPLNHAESVQVNLAVPV